MNAINFSKITGNSTYLACATLFLLSGTHGTLHAWIANQRINQQVDEMRKKKNATNTIKTRVRSADEPKQIAQADVQITKTSKPLSKHKQKRKRRIEQAKKSGKTISTMNYDELKVTKDKHLARNDKIIAIKYVEQMIKLCEDVNQIGALMIELADLYFDTKELPKAEIIYTEYAHLYPGGADIEYASHRAILCSFYATLGSEHDQTKTYETIELADNFLQRADVFTTYKDDVTRIRTNCYERVIESEVTIFNFYLKTGHIISAQKRLDNLKKDWISKMPEVESQILVLEQELANKKMELSGEKPAEKKPATQTKPAETKKTEVAQTEKKKQSFMDRF